jgi:hypothetical protein
MPKKSAKGYPADCAAITGNNPEIIVLASQWTRALTFGADSSGEDLAEIDPDCTFCFAFSQGAVTNTIDHREGERSSEQVQRAPTMIACKRGRSRFQSA